jgi:hypothetical protein
LYQRENGHEAKRQYRHESHDIRLQVGRAAGIGIHAAVERIKEW